MIDKILIGIGKIFAFPSFLFGVILWYCFQAATMEIAPLPVWFSKGVIAIIWVSISYIIGGIVLVLLNAGKKRLGYVKIEPLSDNKFILR